MLASCLAVVLLALGLAACGGGGEGTSSSSGVTSTSTAAAGKPDTGGQQGAGAAGADGQKGAPEAGKDRDQVEAGDSSDNFTAPVHHDSAVGSSRFETKGGDNSIQQLGAEASGADFSAAATALHGYLDARAAGAWRAACAYLAAGLVESLSHLSAGSSSERQPSCAQALAGFSAGLPADALREAAEADVGAFRVEGDRGFLLFRGAHGIDYFMPVGREGGEWKVAALAPSAMP
jgi:hypothetical protein